jgi:hypothetical protein
VVKRCKHEGWSLQSLRWNGNSDLNREKQLKKGRGCKEPTCLRVDPNADTTPGFYLWVLLDNSRRGQLRGHLDPRFETDYTTGRYETRLQKPLSAHMQPGSVVYDVGAHIEVVSMLASELVGSTGGIFAFEADPENS